MWFQALRNKDDEKSKSLYTLTNTLEDIFPQEIEEYRTKMFGGGQ